MHGTESWINVHKKIQRVAALIKTFSFENIYSLAMVEDRCKIYDPNLHFRNKSYHTGQTLLISSCIKHPPPKFFKT